MKKQFVFFVLIPSLIFLFFSGCGQPDNSAGGDRVIHDREQYPSKENSETAKGGQIQENGETAASGTVKKEDLKADPIVYMTTDISPEGLVAVYEALGWEATGNVAVKLSTGEPPGSNYLHPELIKDLVQSVDGTIVECNTAYGGSRASTAMHMQVAEDHGFTAIADVDIQDADGSMSIPVMGGAHLTENFVGVSFDDYDSYIILSDFKGHTMAGFGGAIKNISIGLGSSEGKSWIHSGGTSLTNAWGGEQEAFLETMGEAGLSVSDYLGNGERIVYINVMNRLSVDCDCDGKRTDSDCCIQLWGEEAGKNLPGLPLGNSVFSFVLRRFLSNHGVRNE